MPAFLKMPGILVSILSRRFCFSLANLGQWIKKCFDVSTSKPQIEIILSVSKKLCLKFCSLKWLRPTQRRVRKISLFGWLTLKTLLLRGLIKSKISSLKIEFKGELQIFEFNLFHSTNADRKKELRKKLTDWGRIAEQNGSIFMMYQWILV